MKQLSLLQYFLIKGTVALIKRPLIHCHKSPPECKYQGCAWATRVEQHPSFLCCFPRPWGSSSFLKAMPCSLHHSQCFGKL